MQLTLFDPTLSAEDSHAKTSAWLESVLDWLESVAGCGVNSSGCLGSGALSGFSLKMFLVL